MWETVSLVDSSAKHLEQEEKQHRKSHFVPQKISKIQKRWKLEKLKVKEYSKEGHLWTKLLKTFQNLIDYHENMDFQVY